MRKREREGKITTQKVHRTNNGGSEVKEKEKEKAFSEEGSFGVVTQKYVRIARYTHKEWIIVNGSRNDSAPRRSVHVWTHDDVVLQKG